MIILVLKRKYVFFELLEGWSRSMITTLYLIRCTRQLYTVSDILSMLGSCYPQQYCHFLCLFVYCPDQEYERILDGDLCLLGVMETWADDNMHMHLIKAVKKFK